jgi:lysozyme
MGVNNLSYSKNGLSLTEGFESCALTAYQDIKGIWTIGWGHTGPDVREGSAITWQMAETLLSQDTMRAQLCVNTYVDVVLTQPEFDALVDFVFNCGTGAFKNSTLLKLLNEGKYAQASMQFDLWDHASGVVVAGLLRRREAETAEFQAQG